MQLRLPSLLRGLLLRPHALLALLGGLRRDMLRLFLLQNLLGLVQVRAMEACRLGLIQCTPKCLDAPPSRVALHCRGRRHGHCALQPGRRRDAPLGLACGAQLLLGGPQQPRLGLGQPGPASLGEGPLHDRGILGHGGVQRRLQCDLGILHSPLLGLLLHLGPLLLHLELRLLLFLPLYPELLLPLEPELLLHPHPLLLRPLRLLSGDLLHPLRCLLGLHPPQLLVRRRTLLRLPRLLFLLLLLLLQVWGRHPPRICTGSALPAAPRVVAPTSRRTRDGGTTCRSRGRPS
mmetsp:Transcript_35703/g.115785  ORF Transcript_35703/g.115785 Transcript_35703/m.115785 type:complete len:290 (-) Transcript_35703:192-1061(-)